MDDFNSTALTVVLTIVGCLSLGCFLVGGGGGDGGGPTGNCEDDPATDPSQANTGDLEAALGRTEYVSRSSTARDTRAGDAFAENDGFPESGYIFQPLDPDNPSLDIHSGPQGGGGIHIEPAVLVRNVDPTDAESMINFQVRDPGSGEVLTHTACEEGGFVNWTEVPDGHTFEGMRVIFKDGRNRARGEREVIVDIQIDDRRRVLKEIVQIE